jgi:hypothetical protein
VKLERPTRPEVSCHDHEQLREDTICNFAIFIANGRYRVPPSLAARLCDYIFCSNKGGIYSSRDIVPPPSFDGDEKKFGEFLSQLELWKMNLEKDGLIDEAMRSAFETILCSIFAEQE